jgi:hypothetical protein
VKTREYKNFTFFLSEEGNLLCGITENWMLFSTPLPITLQQRLVNGYLMYKFEQSEASNQNVESTITLINPELKVLIGQKIKVLKYDGLEKWHGDRVNLVIIANLLNDSYFDEKKKSIFLRNALDSLEDNGLLLLAENRDNLEYSSIFRKATNRFVLLENLNGGVKSETLVFTIRS